MSESSLPAPAFSGFSRNLRADVTSGFLVFLIALPLCLAISLASGFPATAGVFTAIVGGLVTPWISNSELTIKGPAAGMIAIVLGCVVELGGGQTADPEAVLRAQQLTLGICVIAGLIQVGAALLRSGFISDLFPTAAVHGMLAAIGVIILSKQAHAVLGVVPPPNMVHGVAHPKEPLQLLAEIPTSIMKANPEIALIGVLSLILLFTWPLVKIATLKRIPGQILVLVLAIPLGLLFDLDHTHTYSFAGSQHEISSKFLVNVPGSILSAIMRPDFSAVMTPVGMKWIVMFTLIGSLESLLSAKAVDVLDPTRRKTDMNRDLLAVGTANTLVALIGGIPMISEIVRSKANIDNGARSRFANMFHGLFLLILVATLPMLIHKIPLAALAAMLVYTGFRLAHPREFVHMYKIGPEQLLVFAGTMIGVLMTDLLVGVFIGLGLQILVHFCSGVSITSFFKSGVEVEEIDDKTTCIRVNNSAVFSTWIGLNRAVMAVSPDRIVVLDLSAARVVDHSTMEKLHALQEDFQHVGRTLRLTGLEEHRGLSQHPLATQLKDATLSAKA